jgi:hypothetical protein
MDPKASQNRRCGCRAAQAARKQVRANSTGKRRQFSAGSQAASRLWALVPPHNGGNFHAFGEAGATPLHVHVSGARRSVVFGMSSDIAHF